MKKEKKKMWKKIEMIEYEEHDSSIFTATPKVDVRKTAIIKSGTLDVSMIELALFTAKCLLTRTHEWIPETIAFARSYFEVLPFLVENKNGFFALDSKNEKILRDFSKTTRHGEIAQGLNYILAMDVLKAVALYDFDYYKKTYYHYRINTREENQTLSWYTRMVKLEYWNPKEL